MKQIIYFINFEVYLLLQTETAFKSEILKKNEEKIFRILYDLGGGIQFEAGVTAY